MVNWKLLNCHRQYASTTINFSTTSLFYFTVKLKILFQQCISLQLCEGSCALQYMSNVTLLCEKYLHCTCINKMWALMWKRSLWYLFKRLNARQANGWETDRQAVHNGCHEWLNGCRNVLNGWCQTAKQLKKIFELMRPNGWSTEQLAVNSYIKNEWHAVNSYTAEGNILNAWVTWTAMSVFACMLHTFDNAYCNVFINLMLATNTAVWSSWHFSHYMYGTIYSHEDFHMCQVFFM